MSLYKWLACLSLLAFFICGYRGGRGLEVYFNYLHERSARSFNSGKLGAETNAPGPSINKLHAVL